MPTTDGSRIQTGRLLRSDHLQQLTQADVHALLDLGLTDVIDLRSEYEARQEGPGPLTSRPEVSIHHYSLFNENLSPDQTEAELTEQLSAQALPWTEVVQPTITVPDSATSFYLSYLADRPDSVVAALRTIAAARGAALVHCAAGKDRTGVIIALALRLSDADPAAVVEDYAASSERTQAIVDKLASSPTYRDNVLSRPVAEQTVEADSMRLFLEYIDTHYGSVQQLLARIGWTEADTRRLRAKLRADAPGRNEVDHG
jgi:protein tyrosine/serine phosphatase